MGAGQSPYRPSEASLEAPFDPEPRPLWAAVGAGVAGYVASFILLSLLFKLYLWWTGFAFPTFDRWRQLRPADRGELRHALDYLRTLLLATNVPEGLVAGWVAARVHRGRWPLAPFLVGLAALGVTLGPVKLVYVDWTPLAIALLFAGLLIGGWFGQARWR